MGDDGDRVRVIAEVLEGLTAEDFAAVLRAEAVRRVDNLYVHHALIRDAMRDLADRIERWERGEFRSQAEARCPQCRRAEWDGSCFHTWHAQRAPTDAAALAAITALATAACAERRRGCPTYGLVRAADIQRIVEEAKA